MGGPEWAAAGGVITDRKVLALGEGGGADGEDDDQDAHILSIGCFKHNFRTIGLGKFQDTFPCLDGQALQRGPHSSTLGLGVTSVWLGP